MAKFIKLENTVLNTDYIRAITRGENNSARIELADDSVLVTLAEVFCYDDFDKVAEALDVTDLSYCKVHTKKTGE